MQFLAAVIGWLKTEFSSVFTSLSGAFNAVILELPTDEATILKGALALAATDIAEGKSPEQTFTDTLNYVAAQEGKEMSKLGQQLLQAFITAAAPKPAPQA